MTTVYVAKGVKVPMDSVVKSAGRVLEVLEYFAERRAPATVSDICTALGYPQSSTSVLLKSLLTLGYLGQDPASRRYAPTPRVALLGDWLELSGDLPQLLETVRTETGETVMLAQRNGNHVQYIRVLESNTGVRSKIRPGQQIPLLHSASGLALLSLFSDEEALRVMRRHRASEQGAADKMSEADLLQALRHVRSTGFATLSDPSDDSFGVISALLPSVDGQPRMAIAVASERLERHQDRIADVLRTQAGVTVTRASEPSRFGAGRGPREAQAAGSI